MIAGLTCVLCAVLLSGYCASKTVVIGCVTDIRGRPISGAKLVIMDPYSDNSSADYSETRSDNKGWFSLDAPPGKCRLSVHADGFASMHRTQLVAEGENRGWDFALRRSARVSGRVVDTKGKPASNRSLGLSVIASESLPDPGMGFDANEEQGEVKTDENGLFVMPNIAPGKYSIIVYGSSSEGGGWGMYQEPVKGGLVKVESGDRVENFEIIINPPEDYVISGHVRDAKGNPVRGVYVETYIPHGSHWWSNTNDDGAFCIQGLDAMGESLFRIGFKGRTAECEGFELAIPDVSLNSKNIDLIVPDKGSIHAKVLSSKTGEAVASCQLTVPVVNLPESGAVWENPPVQIEKNPDASFTISGVPAGEVTVEVNAEGLGVRRFMTSVEAGKTNTLECVMPGTAVSRDRTTLGNRFLRPIYPGDPREAGELWAMPASDGRLRISPMRQWSQTGIELCEGQFLEIQAEGKVQGCQAPVDDWAFGPWGPSGGPSDNDPDARVCALIGRIVCEGKTLEFIVGENYQGQVSSGGKLELGVSDVWHYDNSGEFVAEIKLDGKPVDFTRQEAAALTVATENLVPLMRPVNGAEISELDGALRILSRRDAHNPMLATDRQFTPPLEIRARARTDSTNIRLYYGSFGAGQLIFNWEVEPDQLRIHDPATGAISGISGMGGVEQDKFHDIVWRIGLRRMQVLVDGEERWRGEGDYSAVVSPVGIGPALGSQVEVESLIVAPLDQALMDAPAVTPKVSQLTIVQKTKTGDSKKASQPSAGVPIQSADRDDLVGWFKLPARNERHRVVPGEGTLIPVFKSGGTYYTVSWPGAEIPLKECAEGLEWALTPSSMEGTKIRFDKASSSYSIFIKDQQAMNFTDSEGPEWQPITRIDKPSGLLDARAKRPRTNDDFIGWYQFVWLPIRYEIRKEGEKYIAAGQFSNGSGQWKPDEEPHELKPLPDRLGFVMDERDKINLAYHKALKRFELTFEDGKSERPVIRIPLARIPAPPSPEADAVPAPSLRIGIPSWH